MQSRGFIVPALLVILVFIVLFVAYEFVPSFHLGALSVSPSTGSAPLSVAITVRDGGSVDLSFGDGTEQTIGMGAPGNSTSVNHVYNKPGTYEITLSEIGPNVGGLNAPSLTKISTKSVVVN